jgi:SAM-dependent methyltransferase
VGGGGESLPLDYDHRADDYARHRRIHPGVLRALVDSGWFGATARVLDVGCGTGNYAAALMGETGCAVCGIDPSREMLGHAHASTAGAALVQGNAERLPFADAAFDVVMSTDVIHHMGDRVAYFAEAARVLRPSGSIVTVTDSEQDIRRRRPLSSHFPETMAVELRRYPSVESLLEEMRRAGFAELRLQDVERRYDLVDLQPYRDRAFSSLLLIGEDAFARGMARLAADLARGPIPCVSPYTLIWGTLPA